MTAVSAPICTAQYNVLVMPDKITSIPKQSFLALRASKLHAQNSRGSLALSCLSGVLLSCAVLPIQRSTDSLAPELHRS